MEIPRLEAIIEENMKSVNEHTDTQSSGLKLQLEQANERSATLLQELQTIAPIAKQVEPLKMELKLALDSHTNHEELRSQLEKSQEQIADLTANNTKLKLCKLIASNTSDKEQTAGLAINSFFTFFFVKQSY